MILRKSAKFKKHRVTQNHLPGAHGSCCSGGFSLRLLQESAILRMPCIEKERLLCSPLEFTRHASIRYPRRPCGPWLSEWALNCPSLEAISELPGKGLSHLSQLQFPYLESEDNDSVCLLGLPRD